jgi:hypothetical protein
MRYMFFSLSLLFVHLNAEDVKEGCVTVELNGQFGNQLFEVATAYTYALDHNLYLTIPDLINKREFGIPYNAKRVFLSKVETYAIPRSYTTWSEPSFNYTQIPHFDALELKGFFQSEKYFKHRRSELIDLLAPSEEEKCKIISKYPFLASDALVVGIQIRDYRVDKMYGKNHPTIGQAYYKKAMSMFPEDTLFFVSSNNLAYAKKCTEPYSKNVVYEECDDHIEAFYALSLCKSFIISNSTFGWWAAWLSESPDKKVFVPNPWFVLPYDNEYMIKDLIPEGWTTLKIEKEGRPK